METEPSRPKRLPRAVRELIWVVAVLGLLVALAVPGYFRSLECNRRAACNNNLRQLGLGLMQYSQDFGDLYPWRLGTVSRDEAWRDLGLLYPDYMSESKPFFCPSAKDRRSRLERDFFRRIRKLNREGPAAFEPIAGSGSRAVISYSYCRDARGGTVDGREHRDLPWTESARSTVRLLADKKAGRAMTGESAHKSREGKPHGRNVAYKDGHVTWKLGAGPLDPDEDDDEVGAPDAVKYTSWWSDPPYYDE